MFIAVLFLIAQNWKQSKCPSVDGWTNGGLTIQWNNTAAMKRNELWIYTKTWMNLKGILLGERRQSQKFHTVWFYLYDIFKNTKPWWQRTDKLLPIVSGLGRKWWQRGNMSTLLVTELFYVLIVVVATWICMCQNW